MLTLACWRFGGLAGRKNLPLSDDVYSGPSSLKLGVGVVTAGDSANFGEGLIAQHHAIFQYGLERVRTEGRALRQRLAFENLHGGKFLTILYQVKAATFAGLAGICFWIFVHVLPFAIAVDGRTFQSKLQSIAIHLLEKGATHSIAPDILRPSAACQLSGDILYGVKVYAIALNESHAGHGGLPAFAVHFVAKHFADDFEQLFQNGNCIAGIGS